MGYWAQTKRNFPLTLRTYPGSDSARVPCLARNRESLWYDPPPPLPCPQLCASPVLPGAGYAGPHTGKGLGSLSLALPAAEGQSPASVHCFCGSEYQEGTSPTEGKHGISSSKGMHDKHWLAVSQGKVESQKAFDFAQRNVLLASAYCHHFRSHFWGFSLQGCGIPGASNCAWKPTSYTDYGNRIKSENQKQKRGEGSPFTGTASAHPVYPPEPAFAPVASCCSPVCCLRCCCFFLISLFYFLLSCEWQDDPIGRTQA